METKTNSVRREVLKSIIEMYGNKPKKIVTQKIKDKGVYRDFVDDEEVYALAKKFAEFHKLPFGYIAPEKEIKIENKEETTVIEHIEHITEIDQFYEGLLKEHNLLSKRLLALNKLITLYERG